MSFPIDKGIPVPTHRGGCSGKGGRPAVYLWLQLEVGDSFLIQGRPRISVSQDAQKQQMRHGVRFTCHAVAGGVRVWRVA